MSSIQRPGPTVVITGASSGIGRATAEAFARRRARLVLAARGREALEETAAACRALGAAVLAVPTDVTDAAQVLNLAEQAAAFGSGIDIWFSNAGTGAIGRYADTPMAAHEQVVRTNLIGHMNDAHAVLPIFLRQRYGVFINMISVGGYVATPLAAAYGASKFGLRGFSEALRAELAGHPGIHVCDVYPSFVDTPGLTHGANYTGRSIGMPPGSHDPRRVADAIVRLAARPRPTTRIGPEVGLARFAHALAPNVLARMMARTMSAALSRAAPEGPSAGTLFVPPPRSDGITTGRRSPAERPALAAAALLTMLALATAAVAIGRSRRG